MEEWGRGGGRKEGSMQIRNGRREREQGVGGKESKQEGEKRVSKKQEVRNNENQEKRKGRRMDRRK